MELESFNWNILPTMHLSRSQGLIFVSTSVELAFGVASVWVSLQVALPMAGFWIVTIAVVGGCWRLNCSMAPTDPRPIWKEMGMKNDNNVVDGKESQDFVFVFAPVPFELVLRAVFVSVALQVAL